MVDKRPVEIPQALEAVLTGLRDIEPAFGPSVRPVLGAVRGRLISAMAARDRGDVPTAISCIGAAMEELAAFADRLDPDEAAVMRAASRSFRAALLGGDDPAAKASAMTMFDRSGATERKRTA